ncbi:hypothetical protein GCM10009610_73980 [Pseudonocardia xinjiangensis]
MLGAVEHHSTAVGIPGQLVGVGVWLRRVTSRDVFSSAWDSSFSRVVEADVEWQRFEFVNDMLGRRPSAEHLWNAGPGLRDFRMTECSGMRGDAPIAVQIKRPQELRDPGR